MSEENQVSSEEITEPITKKDPKKVEQGKRLAAISKKAKEEKLRRKLEKENFSYFPYIAYTAGGLSFLGLAYLLLFPKKEDPPSPKTVTVSPKKKSPKSKTKFEGFD